MWLAVRMSPPLAPWVVTSISVVGVVAIPRSMTSCPVDTKPATTACRIIGPDKRESRPTTIGPGDAQVPKAAAMRHATSAFNAGPMTPRHPRSDHQVRSSACTSLPCARIRAVRATFWVQLELCANLTADLRLSAVVSTTWLTSSGPKIRCEPAAGMGGAKGQNRLPHTVFLPFLYL